ncbi:helix-turn-helix transcriptional regulator [Olivibacter sp. SDN3]|uniref:helix-turn-helix domain-containing protein n=1 Tax=Olivibacter sp. SDN3 TaxID=2764720 RepID=UPI0016512CDE|nr:helix-turn-helix transcriptional regulator [Olivibacter sp. SDN3]QNL49230.1 helix-turn-helix transcriptional regulator [Olivibacter sp. SDN3]
MEQRELKKPRKADKDIAARFKSFRLSKGLTQGDISGDTSYSRKYISEIERGVVSPNTDLVTKMSDKYGLNAEWLTTGKGKADSRSKIDESSNENILAKVNRLERELTDIKALVVKLIDKI